MVTIPRDQFTSPIWQLLLRWVVPTALLVATLASSLAGGMIFLGGGAGNRLAALRQAVPFAVSLLLAIGAHPLGHYLAARRHGINAYPPYFIPAFSMSGTGGAYTKLTWPINDRKSLTRVFTAGPIAGFIVSATFFFVGVAIFTITPRLTPGNIELGECLLTLSARHILFPEMTANDDILLHPVGLAGWMGLYFNLWQLFPAGRLDGGRLVYALWGYRATLRVSWFTIAGLVALSTLWLGWVGLGWLALGGRLETSTILSRSSSQSIQI